MDKIHKLDIAIFVLYFIAMLGVGIYFWIKNSDEDDYYAGGRNMNATHIGLSVVATDVGGGFSISLGGLGFTMGLAGSWMLFTGLIGTWLSAVWLIPKVYPMARRLKFLTFPQALKHHYGGKVAAMAGLISFIGYTGFTSSQVLAGAKLARATFPGTALTTIIIIMGVLIVLYTSFGGLKAVIYTDTVQWILLLAGLILIGLPLGYYKLGGLEGIRSSLDPAMLSLANLKPVTFLNWMITIIPIWFVGMTLYQRIYATRNQKTAIKAWRIAGLFEWPVMAFLGVVLGLMARAAMNQGMFDHLPGGGVITDEESGLPLFLRTILPVGLMGLMMSAYFSAIMSTADSCLMAASGNFITDFLERIRKGKKAAMWVAQLSTILIGTLAVLIAIRMENVLDLMLRSYAFMVAGLFVPVLAMLFHQKPNAKAAFAAMTGGGLTTVIMDATATKGFYGESSIVYGLAVSAMLYLITHKITKTYDNGSSNRTENQTDQFIHGS